MQKYFMLTRGRTGSTAILDELGTVPGVFSAQEYFLVQSWPGGRVPEEMMRTNYRFVLPFEAWKAGLENHTASGDADPAANWERTLATRIRRRQALVRSIPAIGEYLERPLERKLYKIYLDYVEGAASKDGADRLIFKLLSNNVMERQGLVRILKRRGYRTLHLVRKNLARQVLSGQIARKRGVYNKKNFTGDGSSYHIDVDDFETRVNIVRMRVDEDRAMLRKMAFDVLEVSYEDFCDDRRQFYARILEFMGMPVELPGKTDFSIVTDDLRSLIANYEEVDARVARMGLTGALDEDRRRISS